MVDSETGFSTPEAASAAFYTAFANCDIQAMAGVWDMGNIICIHPGSTALVGREAVMRSWSHILTNAEPPGLDVELLSRTVHNDLAIHVVEEHISPANGAAESASVVIATNIYRWAEGGWRLLEHHASLTRPRQITH